VGDPWYALFVVRSGSLAVRGTDERGAEQIMEFPLPGDVLGADGLSSGRYRTDAVALETTEVDVLTPDRLAHLARDQGLAGPLLTRLLARALAQQRQGRLIHAAPGAFGRVAQFLVFHGERMCPVGSVRPEFVLRITRDQLGKHIGLCLETVSRVLSTFHWAGLATVCGRSVRIDDPHGLIEVARSGFIPYPRPSEPPRCGELDADVSAGVAGGSHSTKAATVARRDGSSIRAPIPPVGDGAIDPAGVAWGSRATGSRRPGAGACRKPDRPLASVDPIRRRQS
jgi:CRP/FNR family transcriptional regulator